FGRNDSRKVKGSKKRCKAAHRLARLHRKISNQQPKHGASTNHPIGENQVECGNRKRARGWDAEASSPGQGCRRCGLWRVSAATPLQIRLVRQSGRADRSLGTLIKDLFWLWLWLVR